MSTVASRPSLSYLRFLFIGVLLAAAACMVAITYHWPIMKDAQVIHYVNFLMDRGFTPYRDIADMNLPGAYLIEGLGMHIFGPGDIAWRVYDCFLMGLLTIAMIVIAMPYDWLAGLFAGVIFSLVHAADGAEDTGERDVVMATLLIAGYALLFEALRRRKPWLMVLFGLSLGMASSVKPTVAPLGFVLLVVTWWALRERGEASAAYLWCGLAGAFAATAIVFGYLWHHNATVAFFEITHRLTPYYTSLNHASWPLMLRMCLSPAVLAMLPFALAVAVVNREWRSWERWALLLGAAFGAFSFFVQHKGYPHHRYTLVAFMLLWTALELTQAMRKQGWVRIAGIAGAVVGILMVAPYYVRRVYLLQPTDHYTESIEGDLTHLGLDHLQHKVQCLDLVDGCLNALYHLQLIQNTGLTGDTLLFTPDTNPVVDYYRNEFWDETNRNPPTVFVMSNERWIAEPSFDKIDGWPKFAAYLADNYDLVVSRDFPSEERRAYRIYVRKGSGLPSLTQGS